MLGRRDHHGRDGRVAGAQSGITRDESDRYALESQKKAKAAIDGGYFTREIAPVTVTIKGKATVIDRDEHPRPDTTIEILRKMPVVFGDVDGQPSTIVTAGSASGITDGGAA